MKINKITLDNIRSYEHQEIEFPEGSTLLSGDIGSGKTSILLGIEFAFFGLQPGQRGSFLLRNGTNNGGVKMEFELDGMQVIIERTLKRAKTISQDYCALTIDGVTEETSVMELKNKILDLLSYPKEFSKKQNILYKFTVYTPQEEMKQIILEDPATRVNTLRHVFGIDKYKKILENASIILSKVREQRRIKEALTQDLDKDKENLASKEEEIETKHYNLISIEKELFLKKDKRKKIEEEQQEIAEKIKEKNKLEQEIEKTKIMIAHKNDSIYENIKTMGKIKAQIKEFEGLNFDEHKISNLRENIIVLKNEKLNLDEKNLEITSKMNSLMFNNHEIGNVKNKLKEIEICPTCLQDVEPVYKSNVTNKLDNDVVQNLTKIEKFNLEKKEIVKRISEINEEISLREKEISELQTLRIRLQTLEEKQLHLEEIERMNISLEKDIGILNEHTNGLRNSVFELTKYKNIFELKQKELEDAFREEKEAEIKAAELRKEIEVFSYQIEEIKERIKKIEEIKNQLRYLTKLEDWISQKFVPIISFIEKNVMLKLQAEFSKLFSEWFAMLVSDNFIVSLTDDFTPKIEYQDYEIDYAYLSGGERTAVALAYRLALNQVLNSLLSKIKTRGLVILDEPTDGFSDQQLDKMRDVLQQLNSDQLIIVSHEPKIETFVENLIKLKKPTGSTTNLEL